MKKLATKEIKIKMEQKARNATKNKHRKGTCGKLKILTTFLILFFTTSAGAYR